MLKQPQKPQYLKATEVYFLPPMHVNYNQQEMCS